MADSNLTRGQYKNVVFLPAGLTPEKEAEACAVNWAVFSGACDKCRYLRLCSSGLASNLPSDAACVKEKERILSEKVIQREVAENG